MSSLDSKKLEIITDILDIENDHKALDKYLGNLNSDKLQNMFDKFKTRVGVKIALNYLDLIIKVCNYKIDKDLLEGLLTDDDVVDFVFNTREKEGLVGELNKTLTEDAETEEEEEEVDIKEVEKASKMEMSKEDKENFGDYPIYDSLEEIEVFEKYDKLRNELNAYLESRMHLPEVANFKEYIENRCVDAKDGVKRSKTRDPFIVKAIMALYCNPRLPEEQPIADLQKDPKIGEMIEKMREIRDDILIHNMRLDISIAKRYKDRGVPLKDLVQEGSFGLSKAIDKFDPSRGFKFSTFAVNWITQAITRCLANDASVVRIPVHLNEVGNKVKRAERMLKNDEFIEEPTVDELYRKCQELNLKVTYAQILNWKKASVISDPVSIYKRVGEDQESELIEFIPSSSIESPEDFADYQGLHDKVLETIEAIAAGKITGMKNETVKRTYTFKQIIFKTKQGERINIILSLNEYNKYLRNLSSEDGRERFAEFVKRYNLNPDNLTTEIVRKNIVFTKDQREALIYRARKGLIDENTKAFIDGRNYNNVLFDDTDSNKDYTLNKVGLLFEVTRERIRQIEARCGRKVDRIVSKSFDNSKCHEYTVQHVYIGDPFLQNLYGSLKVTRRKDYVPVLQKNNIIDLDDNGNIIPLKVGSISVFLKNIATGEYKELRVVVHATLKNEISSYLEEKEKALKLLNNNKKDNQ